jgi:hypothetical protein
VRLKAEKVEYLSKKIAASLKGLKRLELVANLDQVEGTVRRIFLEDLRREDDLEKEAEGILKNYQQRIHMQNLSYNTLLTKTKQELAKKKKIIL